MDSTDMMSLVPTADSGHAELAAVQLAAHAPAPTTDSDGWAVASEHGFHWHSGLVLVFMYANVCACACMHACMHACMQARNSRVCECMRMCMHACMHACKRLRVCLCLAYNNVSHNTHTRWTKRKRSWSRSIPYHAGFKDGSHHLDGRQCVQGERKGEEYTMHAHSFYSIIQCMLTTIANKGRETNLKLKIKKKITR